MRLFRSIFMAVIVIVPGLARGADYTVVGSIVRYTGMISDWDFVNADLNTGGRKAFDNHLTGKFCMTTAGNNVTVDQAGIVITCNTIKPESMRPNSLLEEYYYALCRGKCADGGGSYSSGSGTGDGCVCKGIVKPEPIPEYDAEKLERLNAQVARQADKSISKDVKQLEQESDKELKKQLECESKNPPKAAKKNFLGIWVCVDTQETVDARKAARATNKILNAFWNEMEDLERAFNKRVRQLRRDAKRDGDDK